MTIDKKINYVEQDGVNNYIKNSESVTVPKEFKARKNAPATKLAYITADEAKMLKKQKPGTPHKGPKGIPSYDSFDAEGNFTSGAAMSAMESGSTNARDRAEVQASNYGAPSGAGPGVKTQAEQDLRSSIIAAGAGQRVNPGFFDSKNVVSPAELARARAFNPAAFSAGRKGGIMDFFTSGGLLGNIIRGLGQKLGFGKRFDEPTYDMSRFSAYGLGGSQTPSYYDDLNNEDMLSLVGTGGITDAIPFDANTFDDNVNLMNTKPSGITTFYDEFIPATKSDDSVPLPRTLDLGNLKLLMASSDVAPQFQNLVMRTTAGLQDPVTTKLNEQKDKIEAIQKSDAYEFLSDVQKDQLQKDLNKIIQDLNLKQVASSIDT